MTKGFLTIAYGDYYHKLAENLLLSYRYSVPKEHQLPFAVIVDKETPCTLDFDNVIIDKPSEIGFMNKLRIEELSPFDETIFIDADCLVYGDISVYFDKYEENGAPFSSFGRNIEANSVSNINNILFDIKKVQKIFARINYVPHFNAATYYCVKGNGVCATAQKLYHDGVDYGYPFWGDEPYISLAMAIHNCKCCSFEGSVYFGSHAKIVKTDILNHRFEAITNGRKTTALMLHWSTMKTHHPLYVYEVMRLKAFYKYHGNKKVSLIVMPFLYIKWFVYKNKAMLIAYYKAIKRRIRRCFNG